MRPAVLAFILSALAPAAQAAEEPSTPFLDVGIDQRLGEQVPADLGFRDETGRPVRLADYFGQRPVVLVLAYYRCPMLCTLVLNGLADALRRVAFDAGAQFEVVAVSIDPRETPELAAAKKASYLERYGRPHTDKGWHFLTGDERTIKRLARAVGFRYAYDALRDQYAHGSGITLLTPAGKVARYFYGFQFSSSDLRLGLVEASENRVGSPADRVLLLCYGYDPATGQYTLLVQNVLRLGGLLTLGCLGAFVLWSRRRNARRRALAAGG